MRGCSPTPLAIFGLAHYSDEAARLRMVRAACVGLPVACGATYFLFPQPVILVLIGALGQALMLPFLGAAALYFHHRRLAGVIHSSVRMDARLVAVRARDDARRRISAGADLRPLLMTEPGAATISTVPARLWTASSAARR